MRIMSTQIVLDGGETIEIYQNMNERIVIKCFHIEPVIVIVGSDQGEGCKSGPNLIYDVKELILEELAKVPK